MFRTKKAAVNLNSQQKFYDNGTAVIISRLTAVSAEIPTILEENGESQKALTREKSQIAIFVAMPTFFSKSGN